MSLLDWFRGRAAPTPPLLKMRERGPAADAPDEQQHHLYPRDQDGDGIPDAIDGIALGLEYADAVGEISVRRVIAGRISSGPNRVLYLDGWCLLRNDWRSFRCDRILKLMLPPAWEEIADPMAFLSEFAPQQEADRQVVRRRNPKIVCRDGLAILLYVARSDGAVLPTAESHAIARYVSAACQRAGIEANEEIVSDVAAYANTLYPSARSIGSYLGRLERDPGALEILVPCLTELVQADGVYSEQEQQAVGALLKAIGRVRERIAREKDEASASTIGRPSSSTATVSPVSSVPANFIALDVETANADMASICSIGLVHFKAGEVAKRLTILVNPEDHFDPVNISIHGIRPEHVANAKTMREVLPVIASALASVVVVHHTHFDRVALTRAAAKHGFPELACRWLDSARVARRSWERFSRSGYSLANLAEEFAIEFEHHDACEDARCAGLILLKAMADTGLTLDEWLERTSDSGTSSKRITRSGDPAGPLAGETVVFTGQLSTMSRQEAADFAAAAGMVVAGSVTKETSILVVGDTDLRKLTGHDKSAKHRRAEQLIREGALLRIIGETDFRLMVGGNQAELARTTKEARTAFSHSDDRDDDEPAWIAQTPEASRISLLVESVKSAKREGRLYDACRLLLEEVDRQEVESRQTGLGVAPWYYEQLAIVYWKLGKHDDELAVLERYDRQIKAPGASPTVLKARLEKVRTRQGA